MSRHQIHAVAPRGAISAGFGPIEDPEIIAGYLSDSSRRVGHAEALYRPGNEAEVAEVLRRANKLGRPVTVVAQRTSTTASSVPYGGWILSMERLTATRGREGDHATAEGGIILGAFQGELERHGWLYPPDPTSRHECSLGASVSCNASGARTFKYGATRRWVRRIRVVLPSGDVLDVARGAVTADAQGRIEIVCADGRILRVQEPRYTEPHTKNAAGYATGPGVDLLDLFIGSEGTLGVITEVEVKLLPLPERFFGLLACFPTEASALGLVETARAVGRAEGGISPRCLEWLDRGALDLIRAALPHLEIPAEAQAAVFTEQEATRDTEDALLERWYEVLSEAGALVEAPGGVVVADTEARQEELHRARHAVPAGANEIAARNQMPKVGTDLAVPDAELRAMVDLYHAAAEAPRELLSTEERRALLTSLGAADTLAERGEDAAWAAAGLPDHLRAVTFGHVGDNHLHVNFLPESRPALLLAQTVYKALTNEAIRRGGTPSAEHGIGKIKREALAKLVGADGVAQMVALKRALDPGFILGRGNLFEAPLNP